MLATYLLYTPNSNLTQVVQKVDNALRWINLYSVHTAIFILWMVIYPVDSAILQFNNRTLEIRIAGSNGRPQ